MKNFILLFLTLVVATSTSVKAAEKDYFIFGDPSVVVKMMHNPTDNNLGYIVEFETNTCDVFKFCYNPFVAYIDNIPGVGFDIVHKIGKRYGRDALKLSVGYAVFDDPVNGTDNGVVHFGAAFEIYTSKSFGFLISLDHLKTEDPLSMVGLGFHFK